MSKPRNPNDTIELSESVKLHLILVHEPLPPVFVSVSSLVEDMDDDMKVVLDSGTLQVHFAVERLINGQWKLLGEENFTEKNHDELTPLIEEWHRQGYAREYGRFKKRQTLKYVHVPITAGRKLMAATLERRSGT